MPSLDLSNKMTTPIAAAAASTGVVGYGLFKYGKRLREIIAPKSSGGDASTKAEDENEGLDSNLLLMSLLKHPPKNMDAKTIHNVVQFVSDTVKGKPMDDRLLAVRKTCVR